MTIALLEGGGSGLEAAADSAAAKADAAAAIADPAAAIADPAVAIADLGAEAVADADVAAGLKGSGAPAAW